MQYKKFYIMYLQLADDGSENYDKLRTDQGDLYIRKDLSAGGKSANFVSKATGVLGKVAQFAPIPGAAAISKGLTTASQISGKVATAKGKGAVDIITKGIPTKKLPLKKPIFKKPTATISKTTMPTATMPILIEEKESFFKKYKMPILIGGGVLLLGATLLILKKRK